MASQGQAALERVLEREDAVQTLLRERDGLLSVLDRVLALRGTAHLIRDAAGADVGFVSQVEGPELAVIRWLVGTQTDSLQDLPVRAGQGIGGRVLASGMPMRVDDYVSSSSITHQFDQVVSNENMHAMVAVPIPAIQEGSARPAAIAYAAMRQPAAFGDDAIGRVQSVAGEAARALRLADRAAMATDNAVATERHRMQAALHDTVGAMLFSIGAQIQDLQRTIPDNPVLASRLGKLESDVSTASFALREALMSLSPASPERALPVEIAEHCRSFESRTGTPARFVQLGAVRPLDPERTSLMIGAVREGLLNVEKHAAASMVVVSFGEFGGSLQLSVADDGAPRRTETGQDDRGSGLGVRMLEEKAARLGGRANLVHDEDGGATLRVTLPGFRS